MSKGKKFDAAEKHFMGKQSKYEKEIKLLNSRVAEQNATISEQKAQIDMLSAENLQLKEWIERLLEYTELSPEDIKTACEKDKKMAEAMSMFSSLIGMSGIGAFY